MSDRDDVLLDLSAWSEPAGSRAPGPVLPPRPVRRSRRPKLPDQLPVRVPSRALPVAVGVLGAGLLVLPVPGSGCGSALSVWRQDPVRIPAGAPSLDDEAARRHTAAVAAAQTALASWSPAPAASPAVVTVLVRQPGSADAAARIPGLERDVAQGEHEVEVAKQTRDDLVAEQQAADDPGSYDAEVSAAQEELDEAEAALASDRRQLAQAREQAAPTTTTVRSPVPRSASAPGPVPGRAALQADLKAAQAAQAQHLAQRRAALAAWTAERESQQVLAESTNRTLQACQDRVRGPGLLGTGLVAGAGAAVGLRALRRRRG